MNFLLLTVWISLYVFGIALLVWIIAILVSAAGFPRDLDGRYANSAYSAWFNGLQSGKGPCCSFADGRSISDVDWDTKEIAEPDGEKKLHYRVRVDGNWIVVPENALVTVPNRLGVAVVWPYIDTTGLLQIRCFMPGTGT